MNDKELIERLWREAYYVKPLSKGAYEALTDAADALEDATSERDAALAAIERIRQAVSAVLGVVLGATQVGFLTAEVGQGR